VDDGVLKREVICPMVKSDFKFLLVAILNGLTTL
jgi:hypothetical protein